MSADRCFHLRRIDVLSSGDDHVALSVGEMDVAVGVAPGHVADGAIIAPKCFLGLFRQTPVVIEGMRVAGKELTGLSIRHLVSAFIESLDRRSADAFAADRPELGELLVRMKHRYPAGFG